MTVLGGIGFATPWLLWGLLALPVLWLILRAIPPAPIRRLFPAVTLLLGLKDEESVSDRTPWWLLLLRMLAVAALIVGLAGPVLNPSREAAGSGPLLIVLDGTWAGASDWSGRMEVIDAQLAEAGRAGRPVAVMSLTDPETPVFQSAEALRSRLPGYSPAPWQPHEGQVAQALAALETVEGGYDTHWFSDRLDYDGRGDVLEALRSAGSLRVYQSGQPVLGLRPASFADGAIALTALRADPGPAREVEILVTGRDPAGALRVLETASAAFEEGATEAQAELVLPAELRARITRFEIKGERAAGALSLSDDS
ncbi:BatA domain-containing protein, partial [Cribrihabitans sp. XS_ASV171]